MIMLSGGAEGTMLAGLNQVAVELSVVLGRSTMPVHHLLRLGRGAVIALEQPGADEVEILANGVPVAGGVIVVNSGRIAVEIKRFYRRTEKAEDAAENVA
jgi:flagellar motor switch protein FliN/FliY